MTPRGFSVRLFLSCWLVYCLHLATDFTREHFLISSIVERHTFTMDPYSGMHDDLFTFTDGHTYHGANPGIAMLGSLPYFVFKPVVDAIATREFEGRKARGDTSAVYNDPRPARQEFYRRARANGWDVRFGLVAILTMIFCMAPIAAGGVVLLHRTLLGAGLSPRYALGGSLLYGFGTPVFFRTGFLNQNLAVAVFAFAAFAVLWNPGGWITWRRERRELVAGLAGGLAFLCDYSGGLLMGLVGLYLLVGRWQDEGFPAAFRSCLRYTLGALGPILLLWWYQWVCFGNAFLPPQAHMPQSQHYSDRGYKGVTGPQADLLVMLLFDPRFGLFITGPILALGLFAPFVRRRTAQYLPGCELWFLLLSTVAFTLFFASVQYTRLQYIHGVRYLIPVIPLLIIPVILVLLRLPRWLSALLCFGSFALSWGMAMSRLEEQQTSILDGLKLVYLGGFRLPILTTLARMSAQYAPELSGSVSPLPLFLLVGVLVWLIWRVEHPGRAAGD